MFLLIINNSSIKGNGLEQIITQFADNTTLILDGSRESLVATLNTLEIFGSMSGLKVNTNKTKLIWIGKKCHSKDKINTTCISAQGATDFNLLGISFLTDLEWITELTYSPTIKSIEKNVACLALVVVKTLAKSDPSPNKHSFKNLETVFFNFIEDGKPDKVKRTTIQNKTKMGGLIFLVLSKQHGYIGYSFIVMPLGSICLSTM